MLSRIKSSTLIVVSERNGGIGYDLIIQLLISHIYGNWVGDMFQSSLAV